MRDGPAIAQFTSGADALDAVVCFGYVPHMVEVLVNINGTNPNELIWVDDAKFAQWVDVDGVILITGSTGARSLLGAAIESYAGGDTVTATDVTNRKYFDRQGNVMAAGKVTTPGVLIKDAAQVNSGINIVRATRDDIK